MLQMLHSDDLRNVFSQSMSEMYRQEVPQYQALIDLVDAVNAAAMASDPDLADRLRATGDLDRMHVERHGAIRVGTAKELSTLRRLFAVMGMLPVGYYDLSVAGLPVHSTAFRPIAEAALARNPFRMFTSLLRLDLIEDRDLAAEAEAILARRTIFSARLLEMLELAEAQDGLTADEAAIFVEEALKTFKWHADATVSADTYRRLHDAHRLLADVVCFGGPHINHLTPRTLDIDAAQAEMPRHGIAAKAVIEGPPRRVASVLLRQTSFRALREKIAFVDEDGRSEGAHTARFGEIEQRGVALTRKGRQLYDEVLSAARAAVAVDPVGRGSDGYDAELARRFAVFPADWDSLRRAGLAFFKYRAAKLASTTPAADVDALIERGDLIADPLVYEDFLPVSAAGIFQSNLGSDAQTNFASHANQTAFEAALGAPVIDEFGLYERTECDSLTAALATLGQSRLLSVHA
ncbi:2-oxoadipate dioxygenase/decarboxylase HglS [Sphingomonas sp. CFBP 13733]|uniref:2-oxoadipate dioxygenase/decarboxylase HglS n=1 Tax=Sphingomonas sp. CFBP 13733 TaxID=2775291 RepID=UPI00177EB5C5|nr:VOC family protein [Sphingomonas sp. CFBP 13733]MBD8641573.1 VOC family protein [Sphingomonas sp. CFBP 13733]